MLHVVENIGKLLFGQGYSVIAPGDSSFNFKSLLQNAIVDEDRLNQLSPRADDDVLVSLPIHTRVEPSTSTTISGNHSTRAKKAARKRKRAAAKEEIDGVDYKVPRRGGKRHAQDSEEVKTSLQTESLPTASTGFVGKAEDDWEEQMKSVTFETLFPADKTSEYWLIEFEPRTRPITDHQGRVVGFCVVNTASDWDSKLESGTKLLEELGRKLTPAARDADHRRGTFGYLTTGFSHGNGSKSPHMLDNNITNTDILDVILQHPTFLQLSSFVNSIFATWAPALFAHYVAYMTKLQEWNPTLLRPFLNCVFAAVTINFGPQTVCFDHRDAANIPYGLCAISPLGRFNWKKGGHLVLYDLKLVIEFPPGMTILIPSATLRHGNTAIAVGETRFSFAQYTAGGLFRWVDHDFKLDEYYYESLSPKQAAEEEKRRKSRWRKGLSLFSTLSQLQKLYKTAPSEEWASCDLDELSDLTDDDDDLALSDLTEIE